MTYQKPSKDKGSILLDAICAISVSAAFVAALGFGSVAARRSFERSSARLAIANVYEEHIAEFDELLPGEELVKQFQSADLSEPVSITAKARWYGNDRIETDIEASSSGVAASFFAVRATPYPHESAGTSLCSVDHHLPMNVIPIVLPLPASALPTDLQVRGNMAYVSLDSSIQSDPDIALVDITDSSNTRLVSSLNTGPGLSSLAVAGTRLYAAASSQAAQLHALDIGPDMSMSLAYRYKIPLSDASTTPPIGTAVFYQNGMVYLGTTRWDGEEFSVIEPFSPSKIGGFETGSKVNSIFVRNGIAQVAASDRQQLRLLDVRSFQPTLISAFEPSGWQRQEGRSVASFETDTAFGRTSGGFDIAADKEWFLWQAQDAAPLEANFPDGIYGIVIDRSHIFSITGRADRAVSVFDRKLSTTTHSYGLPSILKAVTCDGQYLYVLSRDSPVIYKLFYEYES